MLSGGSGGSPRLHQCPQCGRQFAASSSYYHHMAMHRGETTCPICGKVLSHKGNLKCHMKTVHGVPPPADPARWSAPMAQSPAAPRWPQQDAVEQRGQQPQQHAPPSSQQQ
ncbi:Sal-like protein 1 [Amphibalanus amphitrite]|uniref:Sal-like protein 1 n=1 Tax=Amphibalanus amphitrite TaxID=1232801 RepID=A0A6A4WX29_AMPAM|nr:Sal-like protein 1 [Amphibalanus amphitrite]